MAEIDTKGRPVVATESIGRVLANQELEIALTAATEAEVTYGRVHKTSAEGRTVVVTIAVPDLGPQVIEVSSAGGELSLTVEVDGERRIEFATDDQDAATYRWQFMAEANWSGGSINEEAHEIARMELEGQELPSHPPSGELPGPGVPAASPEITRPWAPTKDSGPHSPRKGKNPVYDEPGEDRK